MAEFTSAKWGGPGYWVDVTEIVKQLLKSGEKWTADPIHFPASDLPSGAKKLHLIFDDKRAILLDEGEEYWEYPGIRNLADGGTEWRKRPSRLTFTLSITARPKNDIQKEPALDIDPEKYRTTADPKNLATEFETLAAGLDEHREKSVSPDEFFVALSIAARRAAWLLCEAVNGGCLPLFGRHLKDCGFRFPRRSSVYDEDERRRWESVGYALLTGAESVRHLIQRASNPDFGLPGLEKIYERRDASGNIVDAEWEGSVDEDSNPSNWRQRMRDYANRFREIATIILTTPDSANAVNSPVLMANQTALSPFLFPSRTEAKLMEEQGKAEAVPATAPAEAEEQKAPDERKGNNPEGHVSVDPRTANWTDKERQEWKKFRAAEQKKAERCDKGTDAGLAKLLMQIEQGTPQLSDYAYPRTAVPQAEAIALRRLIDARRAGKLTANDLAEWRRIDEDQSQRKLAAIATDPIERFRYAVASVNAINNQLAPFMPEKSPPTEQEQRRWDSVPEMIVAFRSEKLRELKAAQEDVLRLFVRYKQDASPVIQFLREAAKPRGGSSNAAAVEIALDNLKLHALPPAPIPRPTSEEGKAEGKSRSGQARAEGVALSKEAKALAALADHPDWTDQQVADAAGCNRGSLYRMPKFVAAKQFLKVGKDDLPTGKKDGESGALEAWDESVADE